MKSLLYLENSRVSQILMQSYLQGSFSLITCETIQDAERTLREKKIDLVLTDFMLQRGDASDFIRGIRQGYSPKDLPIVVVSVAMDSTLLARLVSIGVNDGVSKPIDPIPFRALISLMLKEPYIRELDKKLISVVCMQWQQQGQYFEYCPDTSLRVSGISREEVSRKMLTALQQFTGTEEVLGLCYNERSLVHVIESKSKP